MQRWLHADRFITGPSAEIMELLRSNTRVLLQQATGADLEPADAEGRFPLRLMTRQAGVRMHKAVSAQVGVAAVHDHWVRIPLTWRASHGAALFPVFEGALEVEAFEEDLVRLVLTGHYRVPLGPAGAVVDATVLATAAHRTAEAVLDGLARAIETDLSGNLPEPVRRVRTGMTVAEVMTPNPVTVHEDAPLRLAAQLMLGQRLSGLPVVDDGGSVVGVLSRRDLLHKETTYMEGLGHEAREVRRRRAARTVGEACSKPAQITSPDTTLHEVANRMATQDVGRLIVVDDAELVGIVTLADVLRALERSDAEIRDAVVRTLEGFEDVDVEVDVLDGVVALHGGTRLHSQFEKVRSALEAIDGVVAVEVEDFEWDEEDFPSFIY